MAVSKQELQHIAKLARLELTEKEIESMAEHLDRLLVHVNKLSELSLDGVEPMMRVDEEERPLREDIIKPGLSQAEAFKNAPLAHQGHFAIPKVIG